MQNQELYHIHLKNDKDKKWQVNNIINVTREFNSVMNQRYMNFNQNIELETGEIINYSLFLGQNFNKIIDLFKNKTDLEQIKKILEVTYQMTYRADFFRRETALENFRKDFNNNLPSRLHSIYLCDKDGLDYWKNIISNNYQKQFEIFEVEVNGTIFKTNEQLLPDETSTYQEAYNVSPKYWNPKQKECPKETNEYLAQGKIKILSKFE